MRNVHHHWVAHPHCGVSPPLSLLCGKGGPGPVDIVLNMSRVVHSHWSRSVEILCSDWLNLTMLAPKSKSPQGK